MNHWPLFSYSYCVPYIILICFLLFLHFKSNSKNVSEKQKIYCEVLGIASLAVFFGLRGFINSDFRIYHLFFETLPPVYDLSVSSFVFEPGFVLSSSLFKTLWPNYYAWVFFYSLFDIFVLFWFFKKYSNSILLAFVFFLAYRGLSMEFNLMRNTKAIMFFLLSVPYLQSRKLLPYLGLNLLAFSFHYTAILYFPLYFIITKKWPKWIIWCLISISFISFVFNIHITTIIFGNISGFVTDVMADKLEHYEDQGKSYGLSIGLLDRTFVVALVAMLYNKINNQSKLGPLFSNSLILYYFLFLFFSDVQVISARMPTLLAFSYWVICTHISSIKFEYNKFVFRIILLLSLLRVVMSTNDITCYYDNLIWGIHSYEERTQMLFKLTKEDL